ncbi:MAG: hypothetical protein AAF846_02065 [Chloroflexota bacterium]
MRRLSLAFLLLLFLPAFSYTQESCGLDLEDEISTLIRAQRAADTGDDVVALALLERLQSDLTTLADDCDNAFLLLPNQFTTDDESLAFRYPDGWIVDNLDGDDYTVVSERSLLAQLQQGGPPTFITGEYLIGILVEETFGDTFKEIIEDLEFGFDYDRILEQAQNVVIGDVPAIQATYIVESDIPFVVTYLDFTEVEDVEPAVITVIAVGTQADLPILEIYSETIANSIQYPATGSLREAGTPLEDLAYGDPIRLDDLNADIDPRNAVISPDGTLIASGRDELCIYTFETNNSECQEMPERVRPPALYWSPDSRYIVFHNDFVRTLQEADLFIYDHQDGSLSKLTDGDDDDINLIADDDSVVFLDGTVTWGLDNQVYMLRAASDDSSQGLMSFRNVLVRVNPATGDLEELADLTDTLPPLSAIESDYYLDGILSVSPDLSKIAIGINGVSGEENENLIGTWVYNLQTETLTQIATQDDFLIGTPDEFIVNRSFTPIAVGWDDTGQGIFTYMADFTNPIPYNNIYYTDIVSNDTVPIIDLSGTSPEDMFTMDDDGVTLIYDLPRSPVIVPNANGLIYLNLFQGTIGLSSVTVNNGTLGQAMPLVPPIEDSAIIPSFSASISRDGKLVMFGHFFLPE